MSCDFTWIDDVDVFNEVNEYYGRHEVTTALEKIDLDRLFQNSDTVLSTVDISTSHNILRIYHPLLSYLETSYGLLWSSIIIWNLLTKDYHFRTVKTAGISNAYFSNIHKFAELTYYKENILSLTEIIYDGITKISKPVILSKAGTTHMENYIQLDISDISQILDVTKSHDCKESDAIISFIERKSQEELLIKAASALDIPKELNAITNDKMKFLKYLIWLHMLDDQWLYYYYLPTSFVIRETGGQAIAVRREMTHRDITKIMIVNNIIHEPITRTLNERLIEEKNFELSEYPHIVGKYALQGIKECLKFDKDSAELICDWCIDRIEYFNYLKESPGSAERAICSDESSDIKELWETFRESKLLAFFSESLTNDDFLRACARWKNAINIKPMNTENNFVVNAPKIPIMNIIENLFSNSYKYCGSLDSLQVTIEIGNEGNYCYFEYEDNGDGYSTEAANNIESWRKGAKIIRTTGTGFGFRSMQRSINMIRKAKWEITEKEQQNDKKEKTKLVHKFYFPMYVQRGE